MRFTAIALLGGLTSISLATDFLVDEGSSVTVQGTASITLSGTLIGNWDEATNPDGTQTVPGLWGGSGNNPIPLEMTFSMPLDINGNVSGGMSIDIDTAQGVCVVQNLSWGLLSGTDATVGLNVMMLYETFRTKQPDSLFIGGFPIELPVGEGEFTEARFEQLAIGAGTSIEDPDAPGTFDIEVLVAGLMHFTVEAIGMPLPMQIPASMVLQGTYTVSNTGEWVQLTAMLDVDESIDLPDQPLPPIPVELPTILPPGSVASLMLDLSPTLMSVQMQLDGSVEGHADNDSMPGDATGDGLVNTDDILAVLSEWGQCKGCSADLNGDGLVGVDDILIIIEFWT